MNIPDGYRPLEYGELMESDDLCWTWDKEMICEDWRLFGDCQDVGYPYNESYRPIIRKEV